MSMNTVPHLESTTATITTGSTTKPALERQKGTAGAAHVAPPDMLYGSLVRNEIANITTTRQKIDYPGGATAVEFSYTQGSSSGNTAATGRAVYIIENATSDADADGKLALAGARDRIVLGGDPVGILATSDDAITRIDVISEAAEGGHSTLMIRARIPS